MMQILCASTSKYLQTDIPLYSAHMQDLNQLNRLKQFVQKTKPVILSQENLGTECSQEYY